MRVPPGMLSRLCNSSRKVVFIFMSRPSSARYVRFRSPRNCHPGSLMTSPNPRSFFGRIMTVPQAPGGGAVNSPSPAELIDHEAPAELDDVAHFRKIISEVLGDLRYAPQCPPPGAGDLDNDPPSRSANTRQNAIPAEVINSAVAVSLSTRSRSIANLSE